LGLALALLFVLVVLVRFVAPAPARHRRRGLPLPQLAPRPAAVPSRCFGRPQDQRYFRLRLVARPRRTHPADFRRSCPAESCRLLGFDPPVYSGRRLGSARLVAARFVAAVALIVR